MNRLFLFIVDGPRLAVLLLIVGVGIYNLLDWHDRHPCLRWETQERTGQVCSMWIFGKISFCAA